MYRRRNRWLELKSTREKMAHLGWAPWWSPGARGGSGRAPSLRGRTCRGPTWARACCSCSRWSPPPQCWRRGPPFPPSRRPLPRSPSPLPCPRHCYRGSVRGEIKNQFPPPAWLETYLVQLRNWWNHRAIKLKRSSKNSEKIMNVHLGLPHLHINFHDQIHLTLAVTKNTNLGCIWTLMIVRKFVFFCNCKCKMNLIVEIYM